MPCQSRYKKKYQSDNSNLLLSLAAKTVPKKYHNGMTENKCKRINIPNKYFYTRRQIKWIIPYINIYFLSWSAKHRYIQGSHATNKRNGRQQSFRLTGGLGEGPER